MAKERQKRLRATFQRALRWASTMAFIATPALGSTEILGFKEWKAIRTEEARIGLARLQIDALCEAQMTLERALAEAGKPLRPESGPLQRRLEQAKINLEIANDLTANDYFILYLKGFKSKAAFLEAARKLSPDEIGELMLAYQRQLAGDAGEAPTAANAPTPTGARPPLSP